MRPALFILLLMIATGLSGQERVSKATNELKLDLGAAIIGNLSVAWEKPLDAGLAVEFGMRVFTTPLMIAGDKDKLSGVLLRTGLVRYHGVKKKKPKIQNWDGGYNDKRAKREAEGLAGLGFYRRTDIFLLVRNSTFSSGSTGDPYFVKESKIYHFKELAAGFVFNLGWKTDLSERTNLDVFAGWGNAYCIEQNDVEFSNTYYRNDPNLARWMGVSLFPGQLSPAGQFGVRLTYSIRKK